MRKVETLGRMVSLSISAAERAWLINVVRVSAKELTSLILDEERLRSERSDRKLWKNRVTGLDEYAPQAIAGPAQPPQRQRRQTRNDEEDAEMRLAIEASKYEAEEEQKRRNKGPLNRGSRHRR